MTNFDELTFSAGFGFLDGLVRLLASTMRLFIAKASGQKSMRQYTKHLAYASDDSMALIIDSGSEMRGPAGRRLSVDAGKGRGSSQLLKLSKTMWTFAVEGLVEYVRVVFDLFPRKLKVRRRDHGLQPGSYKERNSCRQAGWID